MGRSYIAPNRLRPDHYKGMSPAEQQAILYEQEMQRKYNEATSEQAKAEQAQADAQLEALRQQRCVAEAQVAAMRADMRKQLQASNLELAKEQAAAQAFLDTKVFPNAVDDDFFKQFNTTSR